MKGKQKRVLIGSYIHKVKYYCVKDWLNRIKELMDNFPDSDFMIVDNSDENNSPAWLRLVMDEVFGKNEQLLVWDKKLVGKNSREKQRKSQEILWNHALKEGYEKLLVIESDVFPKDDLFIKKLYDSGKLICSGVFPLHNDEKDSSKDVLCVMGYDFDANMKRFWYPRWLFEKALKKIDKSLPVRIYACGLGCCMIDALVLKEIKPEFATHKIVKELKNVKSVISNKSASTINTYLLKELKLLINIEDACVKMKIHPDTNFHVHCDLFKYHRYVIPSLDCEHRRSNWEDTEKFVKR